MPGKFVLAPAKNGEFRFNLKAGNSQVILTSQTYTTKASALNGVESVRTNGVLDERFERRVAKDDRPYFVLKAGNGLEVGRSQMYASNTNMENGIASVKKNAPDAALVDETLDA
ncbi:MAG: YegP family protein [Coriobacteriia bacterium]|nr:YegP family protein [Coriobacteriia bacterium]